MTNIVLISGSEALARGAFQAGVTFVGGYPGVPANDILDAAGAFSESMLIQRATNEKIALEVGLGVGRGGGRALVVLHHTGLNTAADPLIASAYSGTNGGLVVAVIDDPGMSASMSEQDSRHFARAAKIPMLAPSDGQEIIDFTALAFRLGEKHDLPVLLHLTNRLCNTRSLCRIAEPEILPARKPAPTRTRFQAEDLSRHEFLEKQMTALRSFGNQTFELNSVDVGSSEIGIITAGMAYNYAKEVQPDASFLKLGMLHPLPDKLIAYFASLVRKLYVIEELDPFIEEQIRAVGIAVTGKEVFPSVGELSTHRVVSGLSGTAPASARLPIELPARSSTLCRTCMHRGFMNVFLRLNLDIIGDIGCFRPGELPPADPDELDACFCIGASMSVAYGLTLTQQSATARQTVSVLSESTFLHSGLPALANIVRNEGDATVCILTSPNPATGSGRPSTIDVAKLCEGVGVTSIRSVDPDDEQALETMLREELRNPGVSVIISSPGPEESADALRKSASRAGNK